ncbi:MAG: LysM peptidoglycan-binding domain-containing protein [Bacilli bacterium]|nr:LysM peptidoglycan-binding domain-containing protein [Bacilli bacterium]
MYQIYQVLSNETIDTIAKKLNIDLEELKRINGMGENVVLKEGSYIIIPKNNGYKKYIVKKGDNLYSIARNNNIDYDVLVKLNGLKEGEYIYPNQEIIIPINNTYITKEQDKIKDILNKLNISIEQIEELYLEPDQIITY